MLHVKHKRINVVRRGATGHRIGSSHHRHKLTDDDVRLIRELYDAGLSSKTIAEKFEITKRHVNKILSGAVRCYD